MNAVRIPEKSLATEDRIARLESDVSELKSDVKILNARLSDSIIAMEKGFGILRTEIERNRTEIEKTRTEFEKGRADTESSLGLLTKSIESAKLWMLVTGVGSVILMSFISILGRMLKLF